MIESRCRRNYHLLLARHRILLIARFDLALHHVSISFYQHGGSDFWDGRPPHASVSPALENNFQV